VGSFLWLSFQVPRFAGSEYHSEQIWTILIKGTHKTADRSGSAGPTVSQPDRKMMTPKRKKLRLAMNAKKSLQDHPQPPDQKE